MLYQLSYVRAKPIVELVAGSQPGFGKGLGKSGSGLSGYWPRLWAMAEEKPQVEKRTLGATLAAAAVSGVTSGAAAAAVNKALSKPKPKRSLSARG